MLVASSRIKKFQVCKEWPDWRIEQVRKALLVKFLVVALLLAFSSVRASIDAENSFEFYSIQTKEYSHEGLILFSEFFHIRGMFRQPRFPHNLPALGIPMISSNEGPIVETLPA